MSALGGDSAIDSIRFDSIVARRVESKIFWGRALGTHRRRRRISSRGSALPRSRCACWDGGRGTRASASSIAGRREDVVAQKKARRGLPRGNESRLSIARYRTRRTHLEDAKTATTRRAGRARVTARVVGSADVCERVSCIVRGVRCYDDHRRGLRIFHRSEALKKSDRDELKTKDKKFAAAPTPSVSRSRARALVR